MTWSRVEGEDSYYSYNLSYPELAKRVSADKELDNWTRTDGQKMCIDSQCHR